MEQNNTTHNYESSVDYATSLTNAALDYTAAGISVFPAFLANKNPALTTWKEYQLKLADKETILSWRFDDKKALAIPCGSGSGNLELLDFDQKYSLVPESIYEAWKDLVDQQRPGLVDRLVHETSQSGGDHIYYRCSTVAGNLKLARRPATDEEWKNEPKCVSKTLIETRGQGGYVICYPSRGYKLLSGSLSNIPEISPAEREILLDCARALNVYFPDDTLQEKKNSKRKDRPGDIFNERGDVSAVLQEAGWTQAGGKGIVDYWRRPGKRDGISATYHREMKTFYVWSSNAGPFESERAYLPFSVYALLKHDKDFGKAAKDLATQGYGTLTVRPTNGKPTLTDVENYLEDRYCFRRNVITQKIEMCRVSDSGYKEMADYELNSLYRELQHADLPLNIDSLDRILRSDFTDNYDPVQLYFNQLTSWDGTTDYIEQLTETVTLEDAVDKSLFKEYLTKWLVAQVACALKPEIVNQTAIVLVGDQGKGKTTWLDRLIPPSLEDYRFVGTINPDNKDTLVNLARKILINLDELESFNKGDLARLKSIMTQPDISLRLPYGRTWETLPRRASFVASVNHAEFLNDPTGSRRFLVFKTKKIKPYHDVDMNGVYAQAYSLFMSGHVFYFTSDEIQKINERNRQHFKKGYEHELLNELYEPSDEKEQKGFWVTATALAESIQRVRTSFRVDNRSVRNLGYALNQDGYPKKSPKGVTQYHVKHI